MKVRYELPLKGTLRLTSTNPIDFENWRFEFQVDAETGFANRLIIEMLGIPRENWPTLSPAKHDPTALLPRFPFDVNPKTRRFAGIEPFVINLEGILSLHGLEAILFEEVSEKWVPESESEAVGMMSGYSLSPPQVRALAEPLDAIQLACCIVAARCPESETMALALFRAAQTHMQSRQFIYAIRCSYFCIEHLFANGKHGKRQTIEQFSKADELTSTIKALFFDGPHESFEKTKPKYKELKGAATPSDVLEFIFGLRGLVQHAGLYHTGRWHPSRQYAFQHEAICLFNVAELICDRIVTVKMNQALKTGPPHV
jgi:hypothetical protein